MNYDEYKEHQRKAEAEDGCKCDCPSCLNYEHCFRDQLEAIKLNGGE